MKKININKIVNSLIMILILTFFVNVNSTNAQRWFGNDEDVERERSNENDYYYEESYKMIESDINKPRFQSNYESLTERPNYDYNSNQTQRSYNFNKNDNYIPNYNWDENNKQTWDIQNQIQIGFGGGGVNNLPQPNGNAGIVRSNPLQFDVNIVNPPKVRDRAPELTPGNPGDPDVPVDGGIILLLLVATGFGIYKKRIL